MMTLKEMRDEVKADLDLEDATFGEDVSISDKDINRWLNLGIRKAERAILGIYEDYFLSYVTIPIVENTNFYDYPADIYGNKVRKIIFDDGSTNGFHEVKRIKNLVEASEEDIVLTGTTMPTLRWCPVNITSSGRKIQLFPKTARNGNLNVWYLRNAKQLSSDSQQTDIDEFEEFVVMYAKVMAAVKDNDPRAPDYKLMLDELEKDMVSTLEAMVIDEDNFIAPDIDFYMDSN